MNYYLKVGDWVYLNRYGSVIKVEIPNINNSVPINTKLGIYRTKHFRGINPSLKKIYKVIKINSGSVFYGNNYIEVK